jgi:ribosomal protein S18 acetylase RimI-like enzyme
MTQQLASPDLSTLQAPAEAPFGLSLREAAEIVEFAEAEVLAEGAAAAPELAERVGLRLLRLGSAAALAAHHLDVPMLNRVVGLGLREPISEAVVESIDALYRGAGVRYLVQVSPAVPPAEQEVLRLGLEARDLVRKDNWAKLIRDVAPPQEARTDLRITLAGAEHADAVAELLNVGFETPPEFGRLLAGLVGRQGWQHYLAWAGKEPVALGVLFVHGQIGALEGAATLPAFRGRGAQSALMARRIVDAAALGCRWLVTETGEDTPDHPNPSYRNMLRAGFQLVYHRPNWVYFPPR